MNQHRVIEGTAETVTAVLATLKVAKESRQFLVTIAAAWIESDAAHVFDQSNDSLAAHLFCAGVGCGIDDLHVIGELKWSGFHWVLFGGITTQWT